MNLSVFDIDCWVGDKDSFEYDMTYPVGSSTFTSLVLLFSSLIVSYFICSGFRNIRPMINQWKQSFPNQYNLEHQNTRSFVTLGFKPSIFFFLFQAKDVSIVVVGVGKNFPEKESNLKDIAGSKGKTLRYGNFDALSGKVDEILNEMCGKAFAFLFFLCFFS